MATETPIELSYQQRSQLSTEGQPTLYLQSSDTQVPLFFQGQFSNPKQSADQLLVLSQLVGTRFYTPPAMVARLIRESDPIVTCSEERIRWEGFSECCSVYARVDMKPEALKGTLISPGTTNVDFGPEMRAVLTSARTLPKCGLSVGRDFVEVKADKTVTERKVKLPERWLRALIEAQHHQLSMQHKFTISALSFRRFVQGLSAGKSRQQSYLQQKGKSLRLAYTSQTDSIPLSDPQRLKSLEKLCLHTKQVKVYGNSAGASAWELSNSGGKFTLILSPNAWRGFSGEGQALFELSAERDEALEKSLLAQLAWKTAVSAEELARDLSVEPGAVGQSMSCLSALGRVGFDLEEEGYFQRKLTYLNKNFEDLHPRLKSARKLIGKTRFEKGSCWVKSGDAEYCVSWTEGEARCTCPWFIKHSLSRGPCKHILAAQWSLINDNP